MSSWQRYHHERLPAAEPPYGNSVSALRAERTEGRGTSSGTSAGDTTSVFCSVGAMLNPPHDLAANAALLRQMTTDAAGRQLRMSIKRGNRSKLVICYGIIALQEHRKR